MCTGALPGVYRIPLPLPNDGLRAVNVYAVADGPGWTLIDSGWALSDARELLAAALGQLHAGLGDVRRFLVTHVHRDHYTQGVALRREFGSRIALGRGEQPSLEVIRSGIEREGRAQFGRLRRAGAQELIGRLEVALPPPGDPSLWELPDEWLDDGAEIVLDEPVAEAARSHAEAGHPAAEAGQPAAEAGNPAAEAGNPPPRPTQPPRPGNQPPRLGAQPPRPGSPVPRAGAG